MAPSSRAAVSALVLPALVLALSPTPTPLYGINAQPEIFSGILIGGILLFFTAIGLGAALFIVWMLRSHPGQRLFSFALASILGGAIGNEIDRLAYGHVVDFLQFHYAGWYFPAFNVADSAISVGAASLILDELLRVRRGR